MIHLAVCDDDRLYLKYAEKILATEAESRGLEAEIRCYVSLEELRQAAKGRNAAIDVLFLDIEFGEVTSLEMATEISRLQPKCHIVFLTNYLSYALDVYEIHHLYYVIKDEFRERVRKIFDAYFQGEADAKICTSMGGEMTVIPLKDICYIERIRRGCRIVTDVEILRVSNFFEEICEKIHAAYMVRCHNSFMVNLQYVRNYQSGRFIMISGEEILISRAYQKAVREQFRTWTDVWM